MTEDEARSWLIGRLAVPRETLERLERFAALVRDENDCQNLIARSTLDSIWARHIVDSAQLVPLAGDRPGAWLDLGSGAGFPGLVVAILSDRPVTLVEMRRKRADFLDRTVEQLGLGDHVTIASVKLERLPEQRFAVISARAFAPLDRLWALAERFSSKETLWLLPKGKSAVSELEAATRTWQSSARIEPSITDAESAIIVATGVKARPRAGRRR